MIYEYRIYEAPSRFRVKTVSKVVQANMPLFAKHGMRVVGVWTTAQISENSNRVIYMLEFRDLAHRQEAWASYLADPAVAEVTRPIIGDNKDWLKKVSNYIMEPTEYCPPI